MIKSAGITGKNNLDPYFGSCRCLLSFGTTPRLLLEMGVLAMEPSFSIKISLGIQGVKDACTDNLRLDLLPRVLQKFQTTIITTNSQAINYGEALVYRSSSNFTLILSLTLRQSDLLACRNSFFSERLEGVLTC